MPRLRSFCLLATAAFGLSACVSYDEGYGYGGVSVGYGSGYCDPYWDDCHYGRGYEPWYGWYGDYYYPGIGIYIYDRWGRRHFWDDHHRRYWEGRRHHWRDRDWNDRRWERWHGYRGWRDGDRRRRWRDHDGNRGWRDRSRRGEWNEDPGTFRRGAPNERRFEPRGERERTEPREDRRVIRDFKRVMNDED
jgi:hypothetical protein